MENLHRYTMRSVKSTAHWRYFWQGQLQLSLLWIKRDYKDWLRVKEKSTIKVVLGWKISQKTDLMSSMQKLW